MPAPKRTPPLEPAASAPGGTAARTGAGPMDVDGEDTVMYEGEHAPAKAHEVGNFCYESQVSNGGHDEKEDDEEDEDEDDEDEDDHGGEYEVIPLDMEGFVPVKLADIRKEVQCPICLGIIRKTRTVMGCLHRFCRECIDKSIRLGNNECPACRTHCASRRSLRDDQNYDNLIAALYPDADKYEEEELAFNEEEYIRNKKIQASIAETLRKQSEINGRRTSARAAAAAFVRRSRRNAQALGHSTYMCRAGKNEASSLSLADSDSEDGDGGSFGAEFSSGDECSPDKRQKRHPRWPTAECQPSKKVGNEAVSCDEKDIGAFSREKIASCPLQAWGKNGTRSQTTRHGNLGGSNSRLVCKVGRVIRLAQHLDKSEEVGPESDIHLFLLPLDAKHVPTIELSYLCCRPTLSIKQICQFVALKTSSRAVDVSLYVRRPQRGNVSVAGGEGCLEMLRIERHLSELYPSFAFSQGHLELLYSVKVAENGSDKFS